MTTEHHEVVIIGAGLSGIGAAVHLTRGLPGKSLLVLEARDAIGGTWDLFRYPGVRSDSDMHTLGYSFRPWPDTHAFADGATILSYIRETAAIYGIDRRIRFGHKVVAAAWSSAEGLWTLDLLRGRDASRVRMTCRFLFACTGYYDYEAGYQPSMPGADVFLGTIVHPQTWPGDLAVAGRNVVVIGSGATAVTLVPALVNRGARVTMLQRSPSYVLSLESRDGLASGLRHILPRRMVQRIVRWRNILLSAAFYRLARRRPAFTRRRLLARVRDHVGEKVDVDRHFSPHYQPWDQRVCVTPDAELFDALTSGRAEVVTDEIASFTATGLRLRSGREIEADLVVTATGLTLKLLGGVELTVDGIETDLAASISYKGSMFGGVPNFAYSLGYTNASWTLKSDLTAAYVGRLLAHMDRRGYGAAVPEPDPTVGAQPLIDFSSGYVKRALGRIPKQGDRWPWQMGRNYLVDLMRMKLSPIEDGTLQFTVRPAGRNRAPASRSAPGPASAYSRAASGETSHSSLPRLPPV